MKQRKEVLLVPEHGFSCRQPVLNLVIPLQPTEVHGGEDIPPAGHACADGYALKEAVVHGNSPMLKEGPGKSCVARGKGIVEHDS